MNAEVAFLCRPDSALNELSSDFLSTCWFPPARGVGHLLCVPFLFFPIFGSRLRQADVRMVRIAHDGRGVDVPPPVFGARNGNDGPAVKGRTPRLTDFPRNGNGLVGRGDTQPVDGYGGPRRFFQKFFERNPRATCSGSASPREYAAPEFFFWGNDRRNFHRIQSS